MALPAPSRLPWLLGALAMLAVTGASCSINPQPLPPEGDNTTIPDSGSLGTPPALDAGSASPGDATAAVDSGSVLGPEDTSVPPAPPDAAEPSDGNGADGSGDAAESDAHADADGATDASADATTSRDGGEAGSDANAPACRTGCPSAEPICCENAASSNFGVCYASSNTSFCVEGDSGM